MPLEEDEKLFIDQWVENNRTLDGIIHWRDLISEVNSNLGKLRSENTLKNYWHLRRRCRKQKKVNYEPKITLEYENEKDTINLSNFKVEEEENIPPPPLNASQIEILCWVAGERHKRDFRHKYP